TIVIAAFMPLFTMQGVEGQIFSPMAKTYGYALVGALLATFTVTPMLSSYLLPERTVERDTIVVRALAAGYRRILRRVLALGALTLVAAALLPAVAVSLVPQLGAEFLPHLEEGNLWIRATLPATISLHAGEPTVARIRELLRRRPEVLTVVSQHGRPDDGTDPTGFFNVEFFVPLMPFETWPRGVTKSSLVEALKT